MRPISLEMTAFGSYAETTTLPFDAIKRGHVQSLSHV